MKILARVTPGAREEKIEKTENGDFKISVKEPPIKGRANKAVIEVIAEYFNVNSSQVEIVSGKFSRQKVININN